MRPLSRRRLLAACALVLGTTACARPLSSTLTAVPTGPSPTPVVLPSPTPVPTPTPAPPTPIPALGNLTIRLPGTPDSLDPLQSNDPAARALASLVLDGLVRADPEGRLQPSLVAGWQSTDGRTFTFQLRPDARWQDGQPVTASDVTYTVGVLSGTGGAVAPDLRAAWSGITARAVDATTVSITVPAGVGAGILDLATTPLLPAHVLAKETAGSPAFLAFAQRPVGSGAYVVQRADSQAVTLRRVATEGPMPARVTVQFTGTATPTAAGLPAVDAAVALLPFGTPLPDGAIETIAPLARPVFLFLNVRRPLLSEVAVRRALAQAVARAPLVAGPLHGAALPLRLPVAPPWWGADTSARFPDDAPDAAKGIFDTAGWTAGADGMRQHAGTKLALTILVDDDPERLAVAQAVAAAWRRIGVAVGVQVAGLDGLLRDFGLPGHYDILLLGIKQHGVMPALTDLWHSGGVLNVSGWSDAVADAALDATLSPDLATRKTGYASFQRRFVDAVPAVPLYLPAVRIASRGVRLVLPVLDDAADLLRALPLWWPAD